MYVVYDIETLINCFTYSAIDKDTKTKYQFVLHSDLFQLDELIKHLKCLKGMIGYNNLEFDYPIIHFILTENFHKDSKDEIISKIYKKAQDLINIKGYKRIPKKEIIIPQLDLFLIWHFDNPNKRTSLKHLQIAMNYPNVVTMPYKYYENINIDDVKKLLDYNLNDVESTLEFYNRSRKLIDFRKDIHRDYNIDCYNYNNGKIGENILLNVYSKSTYQNKYDVKQLRTYHKSIDLNECKPKNIQFKTEVFKKLNVFYNKKIPSIKDGLENVLLVQDIEVKYGLGGVHGCISNGVYQSDDEYIIKTFDVISLYPNLPIVYKFYPLQLGKQFPSIYKEKIVDVRMVEKAKDPKDQNKTLIAGFKEAANVPYGKSNSEFSFLYDPLYTMKTVVAGQFCISKLIEMLLEIPNCQLLMVNTDGGEIKIHRKYENLFFKICKEWEKLTSLQLEYDEYRQLIIRDVNNYMGEYLNGKVKRKGVFKLNEELINDGEYHKNFSFDIIKIAVSNYFLKEIPVQKTIRECEDIYKFCGYKKFKGDDYCLYTSPENSQITFYSIIRYFVSKNGGTLLKMYAKGSQEFIEKGYRITPFNTFYKDKYHIDYDYYIYQSNYLINSVKYKQYNLFE